MNRIRVTPTPLTLVFEMSKADSRALARRDGIFHTFQHVGKATRDRVMYACITHDSLARATWKMLIWNASDGFPKRTSFPFLRPLLFFSLSTLLFRHSKNFLIGENRIESIYFRKLYLSSRQNSVFFFIFFLILSKLEST